MLDIIGLLITFLLLLGIISIQCSEYDNGRDGIIILIAWTIFLALFVASIVNLIG